MQIKSKEGCEKTVNMLRKDGKTENIKKFIKWVLEVSPVIGLQLFEDSKQLQNSKIEMTPDEIMEYLSEVERLAGNRDDTFPYVEHYLEYLV